MEESSFNKKIIIPIVILAGIVVACILFLNTCSDNKYKDIGTHVTDTEKGVDTDYDVSPERGTVYYSAINDIDETAQDERAYAQNNHFDTDAAKSVSNNNRYLFSKLDAVAKNISGNSMLDIRDIKNNSVKGKNVSIKIGESQKFIPVLINNGIFINSDDWTYISDNKYVTVNNDGVVTLAPDAPEDTTANIIVRNDMLKQSVFFKVSVYRYSIEIGLESGTGESSSGREVVGDKIIYLKAGEEIRLSPKILGTDSDNKYKITYEVSDDSAVSISEDGVLKVADDAYENKTVQVKVIADTLPKTVAVFDVQLSNEYEVDILDGDVSVKNQTETIIEGQNKTFVPQIKVNGKVLKVGSWSYNSSNSKIIVNNAGNVEVPVGTKLNEISTITVKNSLDANAFAVFKVKARTIADVINGIEPGTREPVTIDDTSWYVLVNDKEKNRALLISNDAFNGNVQFDVGNKCTWSTSTLRRYLNNDWLNAHPVLSSKVLEATLYTQRAFNVGQNDTIETTDKVFLLSQADIFGTDAAGNEITNTKLYTYNGQKLNPPGGNWRFEGGPGNWWLRSPHRLIQNVANVIPQDTWVYLGDYYAAYGGGISCRPVFWYDLSK